MELKIEYLTKLLSEVQEKNEILKESYNTMKENNRLLNEQLKSMGKKSEAKNETQYSDMVKRTCQNDTKSKVVPELVVQISDRPSGSKHNLNVNKQQNKISVNVEQSQTSEKSKQILKQNGSTVNINSSEGVECKAGGNMQNLLYVEDETRKKYRDRHKANGFH